MIFRRKRWTAALILTALVLLCNAAPLLALEVGSPAPRFTLQTPEGKAISLADFRGQAVILKIGTTWCPGCAALDRELRSIEPFLAKEQVPVLDVYIDETAAEVASHRRGMPSSARITALLGDERFVRDYGVYLIPRLLIVDPALNVVVDAGWLGAAEIKARYLQVKGTTKRK